MNSEIDHLISVMLADDDEDDRNIFKDAVYETGLNVKLEIVTDGMKLLDHLNGKDFVAPNILFLDLNMPRKTGMQCIEEIRQRISRQHMPVVIYSTSTFLPDIKDTFSKGADLYFTKPVSYSLLVKQLRHLLLIDWNDFRKSASYQNYFFKGDFN